MIDFKSRQKKCILTSPSGKSIELKIKSYEKSRKHIGEVKQNPSRSYGKKNSRRTYKTVNASGDTFQDLGVAGYDIPLTVYTIGDNHDTEARKLALALDEKGKSKLQLPYTGILRVQVIDYKEKVELVEKISQTVFTINFHEVGANVYPDVEQNPKLVSVKKSQDAMKGLATGFAAVVETLNDKKAFLEKLNSKISELNSVFNSIQNNMYVSILKDLATGSILNNPFIAGTQIGKLILSGMSSYYKAQGVLNCLNGIVSIFSKNSNPSYEDYVANDFIVNTAILSAVQQLPQSELETRKDAVNASKDLQEIYDDYRDYSDDIESNFNNEITVNTDVDINSVVQQGAGALINMVSDLKIEKTVILNHCSNIIELASEYYPERFKENCDEAIDYIVSTNNFTGDDFLFLDKGKEVLIYV